MSSDLSDIIMLIHCKGLTDIKKITNEPRFLCRNRNLKERVFILENGSQIIPLKDYSHFARIYFQHVINRNYFELGLDSKLKGVRLNEGNLIIPFNKSSHSNFKSKLVYDPEKCSSLIKKEEKLRESLEAKLFRENNTINFEELFNEITSYDSLILDSFINLKLFKKIIEDRNNNQKENNRMMTQILYPSRENSYFNIIYSGLLKLAKLSMEKKLSIIDIDYFKSNCGYLERDDIVPCKYESEEFIKDWIQNKNKRVQRPQQIHEERIDIIRERMISRGLRSKSHHKILSLFDKEEKDYTSIKTYLDLIETAINYNESCRKLRTRFFQYTERYLRENPSVIIV
ncbi:hypothetical protein HOD05_04450 [Candidatus Woesearchaeota archaeon]|jgi:hypothetical protein|nr:hypothetical protein [Candidatus Woesearchaeota archaeon]MBT4247722.1 hypothetical protein [Candidatus Woesearchaeota archaeon]MBT4434444.1 hypothetical protein [Candidatus Woesearchaeota archaeon]MBT7332637.1 hypothetical protein [Candidatus Woesearchaeota archaeon]